jgi:hypothetical protein
VVLDVLSMYAIANTGGIARRRNSRPACWAVPARRSYNDDGARSPGFELVEQHESARLWKDGVCKTASRG